MNKAFQMVYEHSLFQNMKETEVLDIVSSLRKDTYEEETLLYAVGEHQFSMGLILSGSVTINKIDYWGNRFIIAKLSQGEMFAEAFVCSNIEELPVNIIADKQSEILVLSHEQFLMFATKYPQLMQNMLRILANKTLYLTQKMEVVTKHKIRDKVLTYLSLQAEVAGSFTFEIPLNRNELADFLSVDRSALSHELSKMQKAGILHYHKNMFTLR